MNVGISVTLNQKCIRSKSGLKVARTLPDRTGRIQTNGDDLIYQKTVKAFVISSNLAYQRSKM